MQTNRCTCRGVIIVCIGVFLYPGVVSGQVIYDFSTNAGVDRIAFGNSIPNTIPPTVNNIPSTEFLTADYTAVSLSDDSRHSTGIIGGNRAAVRFVFTIAESPAGIQQLDVQWEGLRLVSGGGSSVVVWIWNATTTSYEQIGTTGTSAAPDAVINGTFTTVPSDYVDAANAVTVLVTNAKNNDGFLTDYVNITVTVDCVTNADCDDTNPCTDDVCTSGSCVITNNTLACDDGDACTVGDTCSGGACQSGPAPDCSGFGDQCNTASCDPAGLEGNCDSLTPINEGLACDDGLACNVGETCQLGVCTGGAAQDCSGTGDQCNADSTCDPAGLEGNCDTPGGAINEGLACNDGLACNVGETCQLGVCTGGAAQNCTGTGDQCNADSTCDPAGLEGNCDTLGGAINEGLACNDGLACNVGETCQLGVCTGGADQNCTGTGDQCNADSTCDVAGLEGNCDTPGGAINEGLACNDGLACNVGETCQLGVCTGGAAQNCTGTGDQCNADSTCDPAGLEGNCDTLGGAINEGLSCDDGLACNIGETCQLGVCTGGAALDCSAFDDQCNTASCDPAGLEGNCDTITPVSDGTTCDDGLFCTLTDTCSGGVCGGSGDPCPGQNCDEVGDVCFDCFINSDCDDGNFCTLDVCNAGICENNATNEGLACDDGNTCNVGETCQTGVCTGGAAQDCSAAGDQCNTASCDPLGLEGNCDTLTPINEGLSCDDGNSCNIGETCQTGVCTGGGAPDCSGAGDQCNTASCDPLGLEGNCDTFTPINEGLSCDDGNSCNVGETCQTGICIGGAPPDCSAVGDQCNTASCDTLGLEGNCDTFTPINEGLSCDDGLACNVGETCQTGVCTGGSAQDCSGTGDQCNADSTCDPAGLEGNCNTLGGPINEGLTCDDSLACNVGETCQSGVCTGGAAQDCSSAGDQCNTASCDPIGFEGNCSTITPTNEGLSCNDGDACVVGETCQSGTCTGGTPPNCSGAGDQCNTASCDSLGLEGNCDTLTPFINGTICDDGDVCNIGETCQAGFCTGGSAPDCTSAGDQCNIASCDLLGLEGNCDTLTTVIDGTFCDDGLFCTLTDTCTGGICGGSGDPCLGQNCDEVNDVCFVCFTNSDCSDGIACTDDVCTDGICSSTANDANCPSDGLFCTGLEVCDPVLDCVSTGDPCTGGTFCNEAASGCTASNDSLILNVDPLTVCVSAGQTITVTLDVANLSAAINGVQVRLNYDTTVMTLVDIVPTDLLLPPPDEGWVEIIQTDNIGDIDWSAVINGSSQSTNHTIATLTFTAIADGAGSVTFRPDADPFFTKLTRAVDNSTILPNKFDSGSIFIGLPDATITADAAVCDGTSDHTASVPDEGAGAAYAWTITGGTIDSGLGTTSISYSATDPLSVTIDVIVTDANGCSSNGQSIVSVNANPDCTITAADSVCANSTGNPATVPIITDASYVWTVTGGIIETGQGTPSLTFTAGTGPDVTIDIIVTDTNGCVSTCQKVIAVAAPDCTITADDAVCDGSTENTVSVPDAGLGAIYTWVVTGGTITSGLGTRIITYTATNPTSVTIDVTVVGGAGCESSCQKIVAINANPDATITTASAVCDGTTGNAASVAIPVASLGATFAWTVTGGTIEGLPPFGNAITYTAGAGPSVIIDVTVTNGNLCVSSSQTIVTVNANPDATITTAAAVCDGTAGHAASVAIPVASLGATFAWTVTGGTIEDIPPFTNAISYTAGAGPTLTIDVTVTDGNGCVSSSQTVVTVNANPDCTITAADQVCDSSTGNPASVPIPAAALGTTYDWVVTGGTIEDIAPYTDTISYTATDPTSITIDITITDGNGCVSTCQKIVTVTSNPTCTITADDAVCDGSTLNAASTTDLGAGTTYDWTVTGGTIDGVPPFGNSITYTAGAGPSVVLDLTVTDSSGCVSVCQKIVTVNANPDATITTATAVCDGTTGNVASVAIPAASLGATFAWTVTGGTIEGIPPFGNSITYTAGAGPTLTIDVTVTDGNGCDSSSQTIVTVNANPDATISTALAVCDGTTGNAASVPIPIAALGATFAWTVTGGTIEGIPPFGNSITYTAGAGPTVTIDVTVTDGNGCVSSSQTIVTVNANPDATITTASAVCDGTTGNGASVAIPAAATGATFAWTVTGGTIEGIPPFTNAITYTAGVGPTLTIDVTVTDGNGCVSSSQTIVTVNANPTCIISAPESAVCADTSDHTASVGDAGVGATYAWTITGGTIDSGASTLSISYTSGAGATVTIDVTVTNANSCVSSCQAIITVNPNPDCTISANDLVCEGSTGNIASVPLISLASYTWTVTGGTLNSGQSTESISYTAGLGTSLTLEVTVTDANGCVSICQKIVTVDAPDCTITGADAVCFQSTGNLAAAPSGAVSYVWSVVGGTLDSQIGNSITYSAGSGTTVSLFVTVTNANGCLRSCQKDVTIIQPSIDVTLELEAVSNVVTRDVTFVITDCGGLTDTRVIPITTDVFGVGSVTITSTSVIADWISIVEDHTLRRLEPVIYGTCFVSTTDLTVLGTGRPLLAGDFHSGIISQDNLVDIVDFSILASRWNILIDANFSEGADATGDGIQDTADFTAIQVNFFSVGEAVDACGVIANDFDGEFELLNIDTDSIIRISSDGRMVGRMSIPVNRLSFNNAHRSDLNQDGLVDFRDIREFARRHNLPLLPDFVRKMRQLETNRNRHSR